MIIALDNWQFIFGRESPESPTVLQLNKLSCKMLCRPTSSKNAAGSHDETGIGGLIVVDLIILPPGFRYGKSIDDASRFVSQMK